MTMPSYDSDLAQSVADQGSTFVFGGTSYDCVKDETRKGERVQGLQGEIVELDFVIVVQTSLLPDPEPNRGDKLTISNELTGDTDTVRIVGVEACPTGASVTYLCKEPTAG